MSLSLSDLFTPLTRDEVLESLIEIAQAVGLPATSWQTGSVGRTILVVFAQKFSDMTEVISLVAKGGLLDYATGGWLRLLARSVYGVEFIAATFATGTVTLTNASLVSYTGGSAIAAGDIHFVNTTSGKTYTNTTGGDLAASGGTLDVTVIADEVGTDSNASAGEVDALVTVLPGVTCTNAAPVVGLDDETDPDLRQRCRDKLASLSPNGAAAAYSYFSKSAVNSSGIPIGVTRVKVIGDSPISQVTVYVAKAGGGVTGTAGDPSTDLGAINLLLQTKCVPTGITMTLASAVVHNIAVTCTVYVSADSTLTATEMKNLVVAKITSYFATVPIGGFDIGSGGRVFLDAIIGQIFQASPFITQATIATPTVDVVMAENEVPVNITVAADVTVVQL